MKRASFALIALTCAAAPAAMAENQVWTSIDLTAGPSADGQLGPRLEINSRYEPDGAPSRIELRPGVTYALRPGVELAGGYYWGHTNQSGPDRNEHRLWQQASYDIARGGGFEVSGRTRMEQRYRESFDDTGARIRQRVTVSYKVPGTPFTLSAGPEVYFELFKTDWGAETGLSEVRTKARIDWAVSETLELSLGYLNQFQNEQDGPDESDRHILIGLSKAF
ncbi:DUF2490 domain-containing protein [Hyphomonas sp.]|uniref:DUF2490 domain-containing protein n=1 Tax=Hyphomonas sp. TaxID=87 RepID=UPI001BCD38CE